MNLHPPETKPPRSGGPLPTWMPNSPSEIVDETYTLLDQIPGLTAFKTITYPTKDDELPAVCVAFGPERADSEGQWNQQESHFLHTFTLFVSIIDKQDMHTSDLEDSMKTLSVSVRSALLNYSPWINMCEGIESMTTQILYPREADQAFVEVRMSFNMMTRSNWEPTELNAFREIVIYRKLSTTEMDGAPPGTFGPEPLKDDELINPYFGGP